jgi:hypothetical protein
MENPFPVVEATQLIGTVDGRRTLNRMAADRIVKYTEIDPRWLGRPGGLWKLRDLVADDLYVDRDLARQGIYIIEGFDLYLTEGIIDKVRIAI